MKLGYNAATVDFGRYRFLGGNGGVVAVLSNELTLSMSPDTNLLGPIRGAPPLKFCIEIFAMEKKI